MKVQGGGGRGGAGERRKERGDKTDRSRHGKEEEGDEEEEEEWGEGGGIQSQKQRTCPENYKSKKLLCQKLGLRKQKPAQATSAFITGLHMCSMGQSGGAKLPSKARPL